MPQDNVTMADGSMMMMRDGLVHVQLLSWIYLEQMLSETDVNKRTAAALLSARVGLDAK